MADGMKDQILNALRTSGTLSLGDLIKKVQEQGAVEPEAIKIAVLPLIISDQVELTSNRQLRLHPQ